MAWGKSRTLEPQRRTSKRARIRREVAPDGTVHRYVWLVALRVVLFFFFFLAHVAPLPFQQLHEFLKQHHLPASESVAAAAAAAAAGDASLAEGAAASVISRKAPAG